MRNCWWRLRRHDFLEWEDCPRIGTYKVCRVCGLIRMTGFYSTPIASNDRGC